MSEWVKIKYDTENENGNSKIYYISAAIVSLPLLVSLIPYGIVSENHVIITHTLLISLLLGGIMIAIGRRQKVDCSLYINAHNRIMEHGIKYIGQIVEIKPHYGKVLTKHGDSEIIEYSYIVKYLTNDNEEKIHDTYIVINIDKNAVGKKCIVYDADGKVIVDAIEK